MAPATQCQDTQAEPLEPGTFSRGGQCVIHDREDRRYSGQTNRIIGVATNTISISSGNPMRQ